ncbi:MAG: N-acetyl-gamma-glutamyl-phosphate reductase [Candidatus Obscuribacterales bacterium]|nr:N-acetyl-gamma-glutamyl-phosphate reductase [Steroidobacteraceae bacterium]
MLPVRVPTIVLGGTGYVAGELLRLIVGHPALELKAVLSDSQPGELIAKSFAHLAPALSDRKFSSLAEIKQLVATTPSCAILAAAPHGVSAQLIDGVLAAAEAAGTKPRVVDISADFRYATTDAYQAVYKHAHGAPNRLQQFTCAVPEHLAKAPTQHIAHPGCFATATLLATVPLMKLGICEPRLFVAGVTGSSGSGRSPSTGTHHPQRHSDMYAYNPLGHRHAPEIAALTATASGTTPEICFIPHSGPFVRGIHVTVQATARKPITTSELIAALEGFYSHSPFVRVTSEMPRVKDVVGSNYAQLSAATDGKTIAVMSVVDNLNKGAAGGAVQWMNRLLGFDESLGLTAPAAGWT